MKPYVSPDHFRSQGTGIDLTDVPDIEIRSALARSSSAVNSLVAAPVGYDFRGGSMTDERHPYRLSQSPFQEAQRRVYAFAWPLLDVDSLRIQVANQQYVDFPRDDLYVSRRYIDIVSLTMTVNGLGAAVLPIIGLTQPEILMSYSYGYRFQVVDDPAYASDAKTFRATNQWWLVDDDHQVVVKVGDAVVDSGFTVDADERVVLFEANQTQDVTVSYWYRMPADIMHAVTQMTAEDLGSREIRARGMSGLVKLTVGEISLERDRSRGPGSSAASLSECSPEVQRYLNGYNFIWAGAGS